MPRFANLSMLSKILTQLAMLAAVSLGATFFATSSIRSIDNSFDAIIDGPESANLAIARANRNLVFVDRSIYRLLNENTPEGVAAAKQ
jgi:methyl-accepting chemotaxis protein